VIRPHRHELALDLDRGRAAVDALADDGYGRPVRGGVGRLAERLPPGGD
jgi:hypothetical protein